MGCIDGSGDRLTGSIERDYGRASPAASGRAKCCRTGRKRLGGRVPPNSRGRAGGNAYAIRSLPGLGNFLINDRRLTPGHTNLGRERIPTKKFRARLAAKCGNLAVMRPYLRDR